MLLLLFQALFVVVVAGNNVEIGSLKWEVNCVSLWTDRNIQ